MGICKGQWHPLHQPFITPYDGSVRGFGEIYEVASIEHKRRKLLSKYGNGWLYLVPSTEDDTNTINGFVECGGVDIPPWKCAPKSGGKPPKHFLMQLAKFVFTRTIVLEKVWALKYEPHLVYGVMK